MKRTNNEFYTSLVEGDVKRNVLGMDRRYSYEYVAGNPSVKKYLLPFLSRHIKPSDVVLDYGCGVGILMTLASPYCKEIHGFDVVPALCEKAKDLIAAENIANARAYAEDEFREKFAANCFDAVIICDVIHHIKNPRGAMEEIHKLLKPNGKLIILEPNRLNVGQFIFSAFDPNEWGVLKMGHFKSYEKICAGLFNVTEKDWFALVMGLQSRLIHAVAEFCEKFPFGLLRWWGSCKIYLICEKVD